MLWSGVARMADAEVHAEAETRMAQPVALIVHGAAGRMGQAVLRVAREQPALRIAAALVRSGSPLQGQRIDAGRPDSPAYVSTLPDDPGGDVLIDFSGVEAFDHALGLALDHRMALVSGSTGLADRQRDALRAAASHIPVLWSANFSLGVAVLAHLVAQAARLLPDWDCEISEAHHRHKRDAPSGTALMLGQAVARAREHEAGPPATTRSGPRETGSTGYAVVRGGDIVGEHAVMFIGEGERIEIGHRAGNRDIFARGAVAAAAWLAGRPAGTYTMSDLLGPG